MIKLNLLISIYAIADELEKVEESTCASKEVKVMSKEMRVMSKEIVIPGELVKELVGLRAQYASMLLRISRELKKLTEEDKENLVFFLSLLITDVNSNHNMLEAFETLQEHTSLFNIYYLKQFSTEFPDEIK